MAGQIAEATINGLDQAVFLDVDRQYVPAFTATRALDIIISSFALLFLAPLMGLIALAIYIQDRGAPVFSHRRIGYRGQKFPCLKFRSMVVDSQARLEAHLAASAEARAEWARDHKLRDDPRITKLGRFLRKSSLDELPQLINVLRGEMSIVGPRPIVDGEIVRYGRYFHTYCSVRPGITGLWQVSGRNDTTYRRRVALDCVFAQKSSVRLYIWLVISTFQTILFQRGAY